MDTAKDDTLQIIIEKILDEGAAKITDGRYKLSKVDGRYYISENQGGGKFRVIMEFSDLVIALVKYSELVTEL